jgi:hypothetical protein
MCIIIEKISDKMIRCKIVSGLDIFLARSGIIFRVVSMDWTDFDFNKLVDKGIINLNMEKINILQYSKHKDNVPELNGFFQCKLKCFYDNRRTCFS